MKQKLLSIIFGSRRSDELRLCAGNCYTNPEMAGVGKTEEELIKLGHSLIVLRSYQWLIPDDSLRRMNKVNGLCKLIQDEEGKIIGCHMLGNPASELIVIAGNSHSERIYAGRISEDRISPSDGWRDLS